MRGGSALLRRQITLITVLVATVAFVLIVANVSQFSGPLCLTLCHPAKGVPCHAGNTREARVAAGTFIAISSARLITHPLRAITSSIAQLEEVRDGAPATTGDEKNKSTDIEAVADRIEQLSRQISGGRSQLREARGGLQQILQ